MMAVTIASRLALADKLAGISPSPRLDVEVLLAKVLKRERAYLYTWPEKVLSEDERSRFDDYFVRRLRGEPVAYIVGSREFWSLELAVDPSTLIPRPDTECLVECALSLPVYSTVLDLGTGTGAIALAIASERPAARVIGVDREPKAVALAQRNAQHNKISNAWFFCSNWFDIFVALRFDLIVSNPPYIDTNDVHLRQGDVRFEPASALVADKQGLAEVEKIISRAGLYLKPRACLVIEHGWQQAAAVRRLFKQHHYDGIETHQDLAGRDRLTLAYRGH